MSSPHRESLRSAKHVVLKIGSAVIAPGGQLDQGAVDALGEQVARCVRGGRRVTVVSSGAIASGFRLLGLDAPPVSIVQKQAAAAVGQPRLMNAWARALAPHALGVAQVLLTGDDASHRTRFMNARHTLVELHARGIVPIVNENDTVSFDEIRFGDNDLLGALTAGMLDADVLVILSSARGLYAGGDEHTIIPLVEMDSEGDAARANVQAGKTTTGVGGMGSKLSAVGVAAGWGIPSVIAGGGDRDVVARLRAGADLGPLFVHRGGGAPLRKRWIGGGARPAGRIFVDDGAKHALTSRGASLLPGGVLRVEGAFDRGEPVELCGPDGSPFARGLCGYAASEVAAIAGKKTGEIEGVLGFHLGDEVIHRDDLVLLK